MKCSNLIKSHTTWSSRYATCWLMHNIRDLHSGWFCIQCVISVKIDLMKRAKSDLVFEGLNNRSRFKSHMSSISKWFICSLVDRDTNSGRHLAECATGVSICLFAGAEPSVNCIWSRQGSFAAHPQRFSARENVFDASQEAWKPRKNYRTFAAPRAKTRWGSMLH